MSEIIGYNIVSNSNEISLQTQVQLRIRQGWQPFGNLSQSTASCYGTIFSQAMVMYKK